MQDLPPRYVKKPNSLPKFILSLVSIFIMVLAIPVGVYLVGQRTHFWPQADTPVQKIEVGETGFTVRNLPNQASDSAKLTVQVLARSDNDAANLFATRVNFPAEKLEVESIATSSATPSLEKDLAKKWIEADFNNQTGELNLIAGVPNPGVKTDPKVSYSLATIVFKVKVGGSATFHLDPDSAIFNNENNKKLEITKNDLTVDLPNQPVVCQSRPACLDSRPSCKIAEPVEGWCPKPSPTPSSRFVKFVTQPATLSLIAPLGGETISFNNFSQIRWNAQGLDKNANLSINLILNGQKLGRIASPSASLGQYTWKPSDVLLPALLTPTNTFGVEIETQAQNGQILQDQSKGPFVITLKDASLEASQAANLAQRGGDANNDGVIGLTDLSIILSSYGKTSNVDLGVDLNGDGVVNDVDLYLFKGVLLK
jgi:hypothetical protein